MIVNVASNTLGTHTHQLFSGLKILEQSGIIKLNYKSPPKWFKNRKTRQSVYLETQLSDQKIKKIFYDLNDSHMLADSTALDECDYYFKRSYLSGSYDDFLNNKKISPYGFNYQIHPGSLKDIIFRAGGDFIFHPYNPLTSYGKGQISEFLRLSRDLLWRSYPKREVLSVGEMTSEPQSSFEKKSVLFQCRLWDPSHFSASDAEHFDRLNRSRVAVLKALKKEFGRNFFGGLQYGEYAAKIAPELIVSSPTNRKKYIELVKSASVVVTTNGISDSIGWKMGEFVALSKAIICEPLKYEVPGNFSNGKHYLEFSNEIDCVDNCLKVLDSQDIALSLSESCSSYYQQYLRPDFLILNTLTS